MKRVYHYFQKIIELKYKNMNSLGQVFMFHRVNDDTKTWYDDNYCITTKSFEKLIDSIQKNGMEFCTVSDIFSGQSSNRVFLTFDDGFEDVYLYVYPILKKKKIPFCVFVTTDFIDKPNYLTTNMLKTLANDSLCTMGAHTVSHPKLRYSNRKKKNMSSFQEIIQCKTYLEKIFMRPVYYFAYPFGSIYACSMKNIGEVKASGYRLAFSTLNAHLNKYTINFKYFIPRININEKNYNSYIIKNIIPSKN